MDEMSSGITTEWILLADHAEVINGKLYLMGGGWQYLTINQPLPVTQPCGIAVAFSVPWNETNQRHKMAIEVSDEDGNSILRVEGDLEVGRPPGIPLGQAERVPMAINTALRFEKTGTYTISTSIHDQPSARISFHVQEGPVLALYKDLQR
jgi:hypothetical protein